jgi:alpha-1,6-mannosyltransferase
MIGLVVAGVALAVTRRPWWALVVLALAVSVKAPAALAVLAVAWWCWKGSMQRRALAVAAGIATTVAVLVLTGLPSGGGFTWLKSASVGTVASAFSLARIAGTTASGPVNLLQTLGILAAVVLVLAVARGRSWVGALAIGFGVMAVCSANPQPWYLLWALPLVACTFVDGGVQRSVLVVLCATAAWSMLPLGPLVWFAGLIALAVLALRWTQSWEGLDALPRAQPKPAGDAF